MNNSDDSAKKVGWLALLIIVGILGYSWVERSSNDSTKSTPSGSSTYGTIIDGGGDQDSLDFYDEIDSVDFDPAWMYDYEEEPDIDFSVSSDNKNNYDQVNHTSANHGEVCSCSANQYNCSTFKYWREDQNCFEYCFAEGFGDIHWLDDDNDLIACEGLK